MQVFRKASWCRSDREHGSLLLGVSCQLKNKWRQPSWRRRKSSTYYPTYAQATTHPQTSATFRVLVAPVQMQRERMGRPLQPTPHPFLQEPYIGLGRPSTPHGRGWVGKLAKVVGMGLSQNGTYPAHHHSVHCMSCANAASGLRLFAVRHMHRPPPTHRQAQLFECWWHLCKCRGKGWGGPFSQPPILSFKNLTLALAALPLLTCSARPSCCC